MYKEILSVILLYLAFLIAPYSYSPYLNGSVERTKQEEVSNKRMETQITLSIDQNDDLALASLNLSFNDLVYTSKGEVSQQNWTKADFLLENSEFLVFNYNLKQWQKYNIELVDKKAPEIKFEKEEFIFTEGEVINIDQTIEVTDAVDKSPTLTIEAPENYVVGKNVVTYTAKDASGNKTVKQVQAIVKAKEVVSQPTEVQSSNPTSSLSQTAVSASSSFSYQANMIYYLNRSVYYANKGYTHGENYINANVNHASTWGGTQSFSGDDGLNTHFIGHNYGGFNQLWNVANGDIITVTDSNTTAYRYRVNAKYKIDRLHPTDEQYERITTTDGGERIILQTCVDNTGDILWIIEAQIIE